MGPKILVKEYGVFFKNPFHPDVKRFIIGLKQTNHKIDGSEVSVQFNFDKVSSSCIFRSSCRGFSPSFEYIFMFHACCRIFLTYNANMSSHSAFDFLSVVFRGNPIFSQNNFALVYIKFHNSTMAFVRISGAFNKFPDFFLYRRLKLS